MNFTQTWHTEGHNLVLRTTATVEGKDYVAQTAMASDYRMEPSVPAKYVQHQQRKQIIAYIERELFGDRP